jgi:hypothetical protein
MSDSKVSFISPPLSRYSFLFMYSLMVWENSKDSSPGLCACIVDSTSQWDLFALVILEMESHELFAQAGLEP